MSEINKSMKADILSLIKDRKKGVSFADLSKSIKGFDGNTGLRLNKNLAISLSVSDAAYSALNYLVSNGLIQPQAATIEQYTKDGNLPDLPIAYEIKAYRKLHFLPVVFNYVEPPTIH